MRGFQLSGLPAEPFAALFQRSDAELSELFTRRVFAAGKPGYPCRVSLADAEVGDELLLLPYYHQPAPSPYRSSGPIYVRRGAEQAILAPGEVPDYVRLRMISVRAYDATDLMVAAEVCDGAQVRTQIERYLDDSAVAYLHLHNARRGCYSCRVDRVP